MPTAPCARPSHRRASTSCHPRGNLSPRATDASRRDAGHGRAGTTAATCAGQAHGSASRTPAPHRRTTRWPRSPCSGARTTTTSSRSAGRSRRGGTRTRGRICSCIAGSMVAPASTHAPSSQSSPRLTPGMSLEPWVGKSLAVGLLLWEGRAWAWVDGEWLGAFELGPGATPAASVAQWFGEVFFVQLSAGVAMGNGRPSGTRDAARFDQVCDVPAEVTEVHRPCCSLPARDPAGIGTRSSATERGRFATAALASVRRPTLTPRPPPSSASEGTPSARETSAPSRPR